ncbi:hypothetical protein [Bacillus pacificus]|uniref:hypothetical protein n=1 Tax=Bacillus pacificus TaxID=2026187 RepID=UPI00094356EF|nr:hypothetical protein [Bacillus pacificus]
MKAKNLGGGRAAHKSPIGSTNNQWGDEAPPLIKVSLYCNKNSDTITTFFHFPFQSRYLIVSTNEKRDAS